MADELVHVDTTVLDQYLEVTRQQTALDEFRARAEENKGQVDETVYRRVAADYESRAGALREALEPLTVTLRAEYGQLCAAYEQLDARYHGALLEQQELEFRQRVGEIDAAQAAERLTAPTRAIRTCTEGMTRIDTCRSRYVEVVGSEEALLGLTTRQIASEPGSPADTAGAAPRGVLHVEGDGLDAADYALGTVARIGRSEDNDICLQSRGLSRQHAVITATANGFLLRDLSSQNGTAVNGASVAEHALADGDLITLGDARLRFSMPARPGRRSSPAA